jgi:DNA helicase-2/ATP-dependent DNA helicase PcrA
VPHPIVEEELQLLARVLEAVAGAPAGPSSAEAPLVRELARLQEILVSGREEKDRIALLDQWNRHSALLAQLRRSRAGPRLDPRSPYFAHLVLREGELVRDLCLGKATCIREGVRIVDWRNAPVSKIFYRYQQGEEYEEELAGRSVEGQVVKRRTVLIRDEELLRVEAPEGSFVRDAAHGFREQRPEARRLSGGQGAALRAHALGSASRRRLGTLPGGRPLRADKRLPDVASLLDPSQFELISRPGSGVLVVRGSAGSGKTTVALHRVAFLVYHDPRLDSSRTLVITFSRALRDYADHVLPALGVRQVRIRTFHDWAAELRKRLFPRLPTGVREDASSAVRRLKLHPGLAHALAEHVRMTRGEPSVDQAMDDWASVLTHAALLEKWILRAAAEPMREAELARAIEACRAQAHDLYAWLGDRENEPPELDPEDDAILLRAFQLRVGPLPGPAAGRLAYHHLAIDEVQDFAPLELRVLLDCVDPQGSVTLAGDTQQQIAAAGGFRSWDDLFHELAIDAPALTTLRISYRSSAEVMAFARGVLGPLWESEDEPVATRSGPPVECFEFAEPGACVAQLSDALRELARSEPLAAVAVLTPSRAATDLYYEGLLRCEVPRVRCVHEHGFQFAPGIEVAEIEQAKGLEFDYVILTDVTAEAFPAEPSARRLLHVGATRAIHQLWLTHVGKPSPLIPPA